MQRHSRLRLIIAIPEERNRQCINVHPSWALYHSERFYGYFALIFDKRKTLSQGTCRVVAQQYSPLKTFWCHSEFKKRKAMLNRSRNYILGPIPYSFIHKCTHSPLHSNKTSFTFPVKWNMELVAFRNTPVYQRRTNIVYSASVEQVWKRYKGSNSVCHSFNPLMGFLS